MARARSSSKNNSTANLSFEAKLGSAADKLRSNMDANPNLRVGPLPANGPAAAGSSHQSRRNSTSTFKLHPSNFAPALPGQLFYSTQIPVCLWFWVKSKAARVIKSSDNPTPDSFRERRRETRNVAATWRKVPMSINATASPARDVGDSWVKT